MGFAGGDGNLSRYVHNNPLNSTDPTGLADQPLIQRNAQLLVIWKDDLKVMQERLEEAKRIRYAKRQKYWEEEIAKLSDKIKELESAQIGPKLPDGTPSKRDLAAEEKELDEATSLINRVLGEDADENGIRMNKQGLKQFLIAAEAEGQEDALQRARRLHEKRDTFEDWASGFLGGLVMPASSRAMRRIGKDVEETQQLILQYRREGRPHPLLTPELYFSEKGQDRFVRENIASVPVDALTMMSHAGLGKVLLQHVGRVAAPGALRGSQQGASQLQARAVELNAMRGWPMSNKGTTAAIKVQNKITGEVKTLISTEAKTMPKEFVGKLQPGEQFVEGVGHAEQTILERLGSEWVPVEGGASRNVCETICKPLVERSGLKLGGPKFPFRGEKSDFRMFWRE
jgi:hypothetical protein